MRDPENRRLLAVRCVYVSARKNDSFEEFNGQAGPTREVVQMCGDWPYGKLGMTLSA